MGCNKVFRYLLILMLLPVFSLSAQTVTTDSEGRPVIDLSDLSPLGVVLSSEEAASRRTQMNALTPDNTTSLPEGGYDGEWNAKMSIKYQVTQKDMSTSSDFASAWKLCKEYSSEGGIAGEWRLPTISELFQIYVLHPQLAGTQGFANLSGSAIYASATEYSASGIIFMRFENVQSNRAGKTEKYSVRCVRDL